MNKPGILLVGNFLSFHTGTRSVGEELSLQLSAKGWRIIETSHQINRIFRLSGMLFSVLFHRNEYQIAYVEVYSGPAFLWAKIVCWILNIIQKPYVLALHGGNLPYFVKNWENQVERLLQGAKAVIAPSRYLQEAMRPYRKDILLIPNPIDKKDYHFHLSSTSKVRPRLVWLRAFHEIYNPQMAVLAIANLRKSFPHIFLTMIGPDKRDGTLEKTQNLIKDLGVQENITIIPGIPKNKVPAYLGEADIFINTTNIDNTPVSVIEAMGCGLCIVSTNVGGIPYLLSDNCDALLVLPNDVKAMAKAVHRLITEPDLAKQLSLNAHQKAEQFDWSVILPKWEALFFEIVNKKESL